MSSIVNIIISLFSFLLCCCLPCGLGFIMVLGFIMLRRRGKEVKEVTAKEVFSAGVESATGVFRRSQTSEANKD